MNSKEMIKEGANSHLYSGALLSEEELLSPRDSRDGGPKREWQHKTVSYNYSNYQLSPQNRQGAQRKLRSPYAEKPSAIGVGRNVPFKNGTQLSFKADAFGSPLHTTDDANTNFQSLKSLPHDQEGANQSDHMPAGAMRSLANNETSTHDTAQHQSLGFHSGDLEPI